MRVLLSRFVEFFESLPFYITAPSGMLGAALNQYARQILPDWAGSAGEILGGILALWVVLAFVWHAINAWREHKQKQRLQLDPNVILIICLVGALGAAIWQWWRSEISLPNEIAALRAENFELKSRPPKIPDVSSKQPQPSTKQLSSVDAEKLLPALKQMHDILYESVRDPASTQQSDFIINYFKQTPPPVRDEVARLQSKLKEITTSLTKVQDDLGTVVQHNSLYRKELSPFLDSYASNLSQFLQKGREYSDILNLVAGGPSGNVLTFQSGNMSNELYEQYKARTAITTAIATKIEEIRSSSK